MHRSLYQIECESPCVIHVAQNENRRQLNRLKLVFPSGRQTQRTNHESVLVSDFCSLIKRQ